MAKIELKRRTWQQVSTTQHKKPKSQQHEPHENLESNAGDNVFTMTNRADNFQTSFPYNSWINIRVSQIKETTLTQKIAII